jgi:hypothetical protein
MFPDSKAFEEYEVEKNKSGALIDHKDNQLLSLSLEKGHKLATHLEKLTPRPGETVMEYDVSFLTFFP